MAGACGPLQRHSGTSNLRVMTFLGVSSLIRTTNIWRPDRVFLAPPDIARTSKDLVSLGESSSLQPLERRFLWIEKKIDVSVFKVRTRTSCIGSHSKSLACEYNRAITDRGPRTSSHTRKAAPYGLHGRSSQVGPMRTTSTTVLQDCVWSKGIIPLASRQQKS